MSEAKHTPGPWYFGKMRGWSGICVMRRPEEDYHGVIGDAPIAQIIDKASHWENSFPVEANARLIAAAPDLLDALRHLSDVYEHIWVKMSDGEMALVKGAWEIAGRAIAKAEGRS